MRETYKTYGRILPKSMRLSCYDEGGVCVQDIKDLRESDLRMLRDEIDGRLSDIQRYKDEKARKKREYALVSVVPDRIPQYRRMWDAVVRAVDAGEVIDQGKLDMIFENGHDLAFVKRSEVYPCPECGSVGSLYEGNYGDDCFRKYKITCSGCDFISSTKAKSCTYDAWESFHKWLIRNGYLDKDTAFRW